MNLRSLILKRWKDQGLLAGDRPTTIEHEMAMEAAIAVRIVLEEKTKKYELTWRFVIVVIVVMLACIVLTLGSLLN